MIVSCIQMNMKFSDPDWNYERAEELISQAAEGADVLVLPETWNAGFFPHEKLEQFAEEDGKRIREQIGALAAKYAVNIVAGSVINNKAGKIYNTAYIFDRKGKEIGEYDKTHLFTPMKEDVYFSKGSHLTFFELDGVRCGIIICYDIRFPELTRSYAVKGLDMLFVVSQWPKIRIPHLLALAKARAIENQMFVVCCNSCGTAEDTVYGGNSSVHDPWGETIAQAGSGEEILTADCDLSIVKGIRESINVFRDRRPEIYEI